MDTKIKYEIISYDVWGNEEEGFYVNQSFHTYDYITVNPFNNKEILDEILLPGYELSEYAVDGDPEYTLYINHNDNPLCELRRVEVEQ